jgi:hypothetical protein
LNEGVPVLSAEEDIYTKERGSYWENGENYIMRRYIIDSSSNKLDGWNV